MPSQSLQELMKQVHAGHAQPVIDLAQRLPEQAAVVSKLVQPHVDSNIDLNRPESMVGMDTGRMTEISNRILERGRDAEHILQLFPDIELVIQLITSSIISPKDMVKTEIIYKTRENIFPASVLSSLLEIVRTNVDGYYKLKEDLDTIVRDAAFMDGSYVRLTLPESTVDDLINRYNVVSTESISNVVKDNKPIQKGFLGDPKRSMNLFVSTESAEQTQYLNSIETKIEIDNFGEDGKVVPIKTGEDKFIPSLEVIDNFEYLRMKSVLQHNAKMRARERILKGMSRSIDVKTSVVTEGVTRSGSLTDRNAAPIKSGINSDVRSYVYGNRPTRSEMFAIIEPPASAKRRSIGRPLTMRLPSCSVLPVYVPGDEKNHVGYFVLIDQNGNPINEDMQREALNNLGNSISQNQQSNLSSSIIERAHKSLIRSTNKEPTLPEIEKVFISIVEKNLLARLKNGVFGDNVVLSNNEDIYRIMLARSFAGKQTRVLFVPAELITYYAFKYFNNGVGKSYMDDIKILISMRASAKLAKVMALLKSAIAITDVEIELDPRDPDPIKTIETALHELARIRSNYLPLGTVSPTMLTDWIKRAGFQVKATGHAKIPTTSINTEARNFEPVQPNDQLEEDLRRQTYMAFAVTPEMVDDSLSPQFATTVANNNTLFSKRVLLWQNVLTKFMTKDTQTFSRYDSKIFDELQNIIKNNIGELDKHLTDEDKELLKTNEAALIELLVERFIDNIEVDLPKPSVTTLDNQMQAFDTYKEALEKTIESWIGSQILTNDVSGQIADNIQTIADQFRHYFLREYMIREGLLTELSDITKTDEDGKAAINLGQVITDHNQNLMKSLVDYLKSNTPIKSASDKDLEALSVEPGEAGSSNAPSSDSGSDTGGGDDFGGGGNDDFGLDDIGGEPTETSGTAGEVPEEPLPEQ